MDFSDELKDIRDAVRQLCADFDGAYWRGLEPDRYPDEFVAALTEHGWLAALIPEEYGGAGLPLSAAAVSSPRAGARRYSVPSRNGDAGWRTSPRRGCS